jgi:hypothetical protein
MRRFAIIIASLIFCFHAGAQENRVLEELKSMLDSCQVLVKYSYSDASGKEIGNGTAQIQGRKYMVTEGNALFISDGATLWSMFKETGEIYIENAGGKGDFFGNLDKLLPQVDDLSFDGRNLSFKLRIAGNEPMRCKAGLEKLPINPNAKFEVSQGVLESKAWTVVDLR